MSFRIRVDPIVCDGRGVCAELLPERIELDDWGYPIIDATPVSGVVLEHARRAVGACPVLALRLEQAPRVGVDPLDVDATARSATPRGGRRQVWRVRP